MYNICSIYPIKDDSHFDFDYYQNVHMPMSIKLLSGAKGYKGVSVERGMDLDSAEITSSYHAMCHYYFETLEDFIQAFTPHAEQLMADISHYTNVRPTIQMNEVVISQT